MRKPAFCICENKDADQLCGNRTADQRHCFCYIDSTIPLLPKSEISSLKPSSVTALTGLCRTRSETQKTSFLTMRLIPSLQVNRIDDEQPVDVRICPICHRQRSNDTALAVSG